MLPISERLSLHEVAAPLSRRDETWPISLFDQTEDEECRGVHHLPRAERCAFIRTHCGADEPGFHACLEFYYCRLPHASALGFVGLALWLGWLFSTIGIAASDFFCINLSTLAELLGLSESLAGVTFLAFGNGSPDVFSTFAAMSSGSGSLALGELFGAATFITAVVAGSMALIKPFRVSRKSFVRDVGFFVVAASFSMVFLADGKLQLWECLAMVGFYLFYVVFVVLWHWWIARNRQKREREAVVRGHFLPTLGDEVEGEFEQGGAYRDEPDENIRSAVSRGVSSQDWSALERNNSPHPSDEEDEEEARERWMSELSSNMRLTRPSATHRTSRTNTLSTVRPSLVGALEFQAVLKSLQKSRNLQPHIYPMQHARRYSDDPTFTSVQQQDRMSSASDPAARPPLHVTAPEGTRLAVPLSAPAAGRTRAVSANDAESLRINHGFHQDHRIMPSESPRQGSLIEVSNDDQGIPAPPSFNVPSHTQAAAPSSPSGVEGQPHPQPSTSLLQLDNPSPSPDLLAPALSQSPGSDAAFSRSHASEQQQHLLPPSLPRQGSKPPRSVPTDSTCRVPSARSLPRIVIPPDDRERSSQTSSPYHRSPVPSLHLPPPLASPESLPTSQSEPPPAPRFLTRIWPYAILPPPGVLGATLFPTVYHWREKTWWEKALGVVSAPSVFLLTITLPVVETEAKPKIEDQPISPAMVPPSDEPPEHWNRWLTITQLVLAPLFIILAIYTQSPTPLPLRWLLRATLLSLLTSLLLLLPLLLTTTPTRRPTPYRPVLALAGFTVSIAWISTIATHVVGALKALAIILDLSHALLGLTLFAVGNSLGDLVADVTVARLGYPVMALSACFGGPMLNILLGIGLTGTYLLLVRGGGFGAEPVTIEVGPTLWVSGATLLVTLVGLLVVVPANRWVMSRGIGWGLIGLWVGSTGGNVAVEFGGWGK
ncbi:hypothetical protein M433DRAFT_59459 [Acidomyces richmondensis BFW]|nr:MAG: hypothetical protein FE78DRAFT_155317 [Acidomyces sp. 'richmondensis']KYG49299.1 hypothetical protein M433DRAFT_59459 [Acidomyces richmondensis BFW]